MCVLKLGGEPLKKNNCWLSMWNVGGGLLLICCDYELIKVIE